MGFGDQLKAFADKTNGNIEKTVRYAILLAAQGCVLKSPVDTGRFRGNWAFGVGSIDPTTSENTDKSGGQTLSAIKQKVDTQVTGDAARGVFWVSNSLPYAMRLEMGYSKQAPAGMVRITMVELPRAVEAYGRGLL